MDYLQTVGKKRQELAEKQRIQDSLNAVTSVKESVEAASDLDRKHRETHEPKVEVKNWPSIATPQDIEQLGKCINDLSQATQQAFAAYTAQINERVRELESSLQTGSKEQKEDTSGLLKSLVASIPKPPEFPKTFSVSNLEDIKTYFEQLSNNLTTAFRGLELSPKIQVKPADVIVEQSNIDLSKVEKSLADTLNALKLLKPEKLDLSDVIQASNATTKAINNLRFPVPNYVIPFSQNGKGTQVVLDSSGNVPVSGTVTATITGVSTAANQTTMITELLVMNGAMAMQVDDTGTTLYQGWAEPGTATSAASWRIRRVVTSGTPSDSSITFADGDRSFNNIWDNRASLSYS